MKLRMLAVCILAVTVVAATTAAAQQMTPEEQEAMMKAMAPGEHHQHLARFAGKFEASVTTWMAPGGPAQESKGTSESTMILGGRYLQDVVKSNFAGMPFEGMGITGYDNISQQYCFAWVDNMGTGIMTATGTCSDGGKTITFEGKVSMPGVPVPVPFKEVLKWVDETTHVFEMYMASEKGEMFKTMEATYKRVQ